MLTAGYLFPVAFRSFFPGNDVSLPEESEEPNALMTVPMILLCCVSLVMGIWGVRILEGIGF